MTSSSPHKGATAASGSSETGGFPHFNDGDVFIILSPSRQYHLHSRTLRMHSSLMADMLSEENAAQLSGKARKEGVNTKYRVELDMPGTDIDVGEVGRLRLRRLDDRGKPSGYFTSPLSTLGAGTIPPLLHTHYDNILRAYYYQSLALSDSSIGRVLRDVIGLTDVAEYLGSVKVVSLPIDNALVRQGQMLWRSIAADPIAWADLAYRLRSELLFREAVIHLVGQWNMLSATPSSSSSDEPAAAQESSKSINAKGKGRVTAAASNTDDAAATPPELPKIYRLRGPIRRLCERKHADLSDMKRAIELRIMGHYPSHLRRAHPAAQGGSSANALPNVTTGSRTLRGRGLTTKISAYSADVLAWMALNLFRHWVGQHMCGDLNRGALDGGYAFYHALAAGGNAYIDHEAVERFVQVFPLSAKGRGQFVDQVGLIKEDVKVFVMELCKGRCMLDLGRWPVGYLTCVDVGKGDLPWVEGERRGRELAMEKLAEKKLQECVPKEQGEPRAMAGGRVGESTKTLGKRSSGGGAVSKDAEVQDVPASKKRRLDTPEPQEFFRSKPWPGAVGSTTRRVEGKEVVLAHKQTLHSSKPGNDETGTPLSERRKKRDASGSPSNPRINEATSPFRSASGDKKSKRDSHSGEGEFREVNATEGVLDMSSGVGGTHGGFVVGEVEDEGYDTDDGMDVDEGAGEVAEDGSDAGERTLYSG